MGPRHTGLTIWETLFATATAAVFVALGIAMIWAGSALRQQRTDRVGHGIRVKGTMVGLERIGAGLDDDRAEAGLAPVVRFETRDGRTLTVRALGPRPYWFHERTGDEVVVIYDPERPSDARIDEFPPIWFAPLLFWLIGFAAVVIPPFTIWRHAYAADSVDAPLSPASPDNQPREGGA